MPVEAHMKRSVITVQRQRQIILNLNETADPTTQTIGKGGREEKNCHIESGETNWFETCTN